MICMELERCRVNRNTFMDFPLNHRPFGRRELVKDEAAKRCEASLISFRLSNIIRQEENLFGNGGCTRQGWKNI